MFAHGCRVKSADPTFSQSISSYRVLAACFCSLARAMDRRLIGLAEQWEGNKEVRERLRKTGTVFVWPDDPNLVLRPTIKSAEMNLPVLLPLLGRLASQDGKMRMFLIARLQASLLGGSRLTSGKAPILRGSRLCVLCILNTLVVAVLLPSRMPGCKHEIPVGVISQVGQAPSALGQRCLQSQGPDQS